MDPAAGLRLPAARKQAHVGLFAGNKFSGYMELSKREAQMPVTRSYPVFFKPWEDDYATEFLPWTAIKPPDLAVPRKFEDLP